jgi:hypothetical protein
MYVLNFQQEFLYFQCARLLLTYKCDVTIVDKDNLTAYETAISKGFTQLATEIKLVEEKYSAMSI